MLLRTLLLLASLGAPAVDAPSSGQPGRAAGPRRSSSRAARPLAVVPPRARPGDAILVTVASAAALPEGHIGGRALSFFPAGKGFRAVAALPVETTPGRVDIEVVRRVGAGGAPEVLATSVEVLEPRFRSSRLSVAPQFVEPPPDVKERQEADREAFTRAFSQPMGPPLFTRRFRRPMAARTTGRFGDERLFNGEKASQHYGLDFAARVGAPVRAANDGVVVLARDCWASGQSVVLHHGAGLYTVYFHLSKVLVAEGDLVERGRRIGRSGNSGRSTGPHLHWGVRVGDLYVDPSSVLALDVAPPKSGPAPAAASSASGRTKGASTSR